MLEDGHADAAEREPLVVHLLEKPADDEAREPRQSVFWTVAMYSLLTVTNFTIAIPTSVQFTASFGVPNELAGVVVGLVPVFGGIVQPLVFWVLENYSLRSVLVVGCVLNVAMNVLYALSPLTNSFATVVVSRMFMGAVSGPTYIVAYIARTTGKKSRIKYMLRMSAFIGLGYALGPFLGLICELIVNGAGLKAREFSSSTLPAWLMAILFACEIVLLAACFNDEAATTVPPARKGKAGADTIPWKKIVPFYLVVFLTPLNVASWEINSIFYATVDFGWSIEIGALVLGAVNAACVILAMVHLSINRFVDDAAIGAIISFALAVLGSVLIFDYKTAVAGHATLVVLSGLFLIFGMQNAKGFIFGINSKWCPSPSNRKKVMMYNNMIYIIGRGLGAIIAPYVQQDQSYGAFLLGINLAAIATLAATECTSVRVEKGVKEHAISKQSMHTAHSLLGCAVSERVD